jgi:putative ABC transport system permease protein
MMSFFIVISCGLKTAVSSVSRAVATAPCDCARLFDPTPVVNGQRGVEHVYAQTTRALKREIIRMALGAPATDVRALVVRQGLALTGIGLAAGFLGAYLLAPLLDRLLIRMPATDPVTFAGTALVLITTTLMACFLPARRATRIDPIATLRAE